MPELTIIAGPNGAGKTTLTQYLISKKYLGESIPVINPDEILKLTTTNEVSASKKALILRNTLLKQNKNFAIETTFSGNSELRLIKKAKEKGYFIKLYFITLETAQDCIDRVKNRVVEGGHNVKDEDIKRRYLSSHKNLLNIIPIIDNLFIFDNSSINRKLIFASSKQAPIKISKSFQSGFLDTIISKFN